MNIAIGNLTQLGIVRVSGTDASSFLQAQMTQAMSAMNPAQVLLTGYCTAKGRQLATFIACRHEDAYFLITHKGLVESVVKRLKMFVLRSKVVLEDVSPQYQINFIQAQAGEAMKKTAQENGSLLLTLRALPGQPAPCALELLPRPLDAEPDSQGHPAPSAADNAFSLTLIKLGIALVTPQTVEQFVPQQINFDLVGGVSFDKGCYPGQEVVARSHYLGKSKKRSVIGVLATTSLVTEKSDVWLEGKNNEPVGLVVNAAMDGDHCVVLFECPIDLALEAQANLNVDFAGQRIPVLRIELPAYDIQAKGNQYA